MKIIDTIELALTYLKQGMKIEIEIETNYGNWGGGESETKE